VPVGLFAAEVAGVQAALSTQGRRTMIRRWASPFGSNPSSAAVRRWRYPSPVSVWDFPAVVRMTPSRARPLPNQRLLHLRLL